MKKKSAQSINPRKSVIQTSYDIVKAHGGELTLASNEEVGTQFTIKIPIA
jgi:sensor histidine kinase regulating citrate/malate metabolism